MRDEERRTRSNEAPVIGGLPPVPGILAAMHLSPGLAVHLRGLADELLVKDFPGSTLTRAERELRASLALEIRHQAAYGVSMHVHGSCHCGQVQYEATVDPERTTICHCTDCQALTGSAYRVTVPADEGSLRMVAGEPSIYVKVGDNGARRAQAFCSRCGSPLYTYAADNPQIYGLRIGCIVEREKLIPRKQKWCRSALRWTESLASIERQETE